VPCAINHFFTVFPKKNLKALIILGRLPNGQRENIFLRRGASPWVSSAFTLVKWLIKNISRERSIVLMLRKPKDFIDLTTIILDIPYTYSCFVLEDARVCIMSQKDFFKAIENKPIFLQRLMSQMAMELRYIEERLVTLTSKGVEQRVAEAILFLYESFGVLEDGRTINCSLRRADIAMIGNMTVANAIRTLSAMAKQGLIEWKDDKLTINDMNAIKKIAYGM